MRRAYFFIAVLLVVLCLEVVPRRWQTYLDLKTGYEKRVEYVLWVVPAETKISPTRLSTWAELPESAIKNASWHEVQHGPTIAMVNWSYPKVKGYLEGMESFLIDEISRKVYAERALRYLTESKSHQTLLEKLKLHGTYLSLRDPGLGPVTLGEIISIWDPSGLKGETH